MSNSSVSSGLDDVIIFADLSKDDQVKLLQDLGELAVEDGMPRKADAFFLPGSKPKPYEYGAHSFGYIAAPDGSNQLPIVHASAIEPDTSLMNTPLWVGMGGLRVARYPGRGKRTILFDFYGRNHVGDAAEDLHFNTKYDLINNDHAGVLNMPIFVGINAGSDGVSFECTTVNVANHDDEAFLNFLESDEFKAGLQLATTVQPAIGAFSATALGITKNIAKRHRNVAVQKFALGLDFSVQTAAGARLREGTYVAAQVPQSDVHIWSWDKWAWDVPTGQIVPAQGEPERFPLNAVLINIRRSGG